MHSSLEDGLRMTVDSDLKVKATLIAGDTKTLLTIIVVNVTLNKRNSFNGYYT